MMDVAYKEQGMHNILIVTTIIQLVCPTFNDVRHLMLRELIGEDCYDWWLSY